MITVKWNRSTYEASVSSRCWWYTVYDAGWEKSADYGPDLSADVELAEIVCMEAEIAPIPEWARGDCRAGDELYLALRALPVPPSASRCRDRHRQ